MTTRSQLLDTIRRYLSIYADDIRRLAEHLRGEW